MNSKPPIYLYNKYDYDDFMRKKIYFMMTILIVASFFIISCEKGKEEVMMGPPAGKATLHVTVVDNSTQEPIENVIFYLGIGGQQYQTDSEGKCITNEESKGEYSANAYKKGYVRFMEPIILKEGDNYLTIEMEKEQSPPSELSVEGKVVEEVSGKGSKSEAHFIKIRYDDGKEDYLFNNVGYNSIDKEFIGKKAVVKGYKGIGYIGWWGSEQEGIYVEEIESLSFWE